MFVVIAGVNKQKDVDDIKKDRTVLLNFLTLILYY